MDYFKIDSETLGTGAKIPILKLGDAGELYYELALEMIAVIEACAARGKPAVLIVPVGPIGQYPVFTRLVISRKLSLGNCWFINMDEYLDERDQWVKTDHPLSFRGRMEKEVYGKLPPELTVPEERRVFPHPDRLDEIPKLIERLGGVDACFGGIGINGHLAFNEPRPDLPVDTYAKTSVRVLDIAPETRATNAPGGALSFTPARCVTVGMAEILGAAKLRLACFREWHRGAVRQAAYGEVSASFPVTLAQAHRDVKLYISQTAAALPY